MILSYSLSFSRRVQRFKEQMKKAAEGSFELQEKLGGNDEISELYDYLHTMIHDIQRLLAEVYREKIHAEQLKTSQKDAELKLLTSQINPHFLYNTLETIRMKARVSKQYEIEDLVKMLGKILRSSISAGEKEVSVASEVELVESYLKIQKYRFGERMAYEIFVEEGVEKKKIIPLILQPIVENSIIHGFEGREETGHIQIRVEARKEDLVILVEDDGNGIEGEKLAQIREELKYHRFKGTYRGVQCKPEDKIKIWGRLRSGGGEQAGRKNRGENASSSGFISKSREDVKYMVCYSFILSSSVILMPEAVRIVFKSTYLSYISLYAADSLS